MKILLDEGVPQRLRHELPGDEVESVGFRGWQGTRNGELLRLVEREGYDLLITCDRNMRYQQKVTERPFAVLLLSPPELRILKNHIHQIAHLIQTIRPGQYREYAVPGK